MDERRFDAWTRAMVGDQTSRRGVLRLLGGGALGGVSGTIAEEAAARCRQLGKKCERGERCCGGGRCTRRRCRCRVGRPRCRKQCCGPGELCVGGRCLTGAGSCPASADGCLVPDSAVCDPVKGCFCFTSTVGGAARCGRFDPETTCGLTCTTDGGCAGLGLGAFCALKTGASCCFGLTVGEGFCVAPCPR